MEYKDFGVIVCKAKTSNDVHYTFKISISENLYSVEFYDFLFDAAGIMLIPLNTQFQYEKMKLEVTDNLAKALLNAVE